MNLETANQFILQQGWTPRAKARRKTGKLYLYAVKRNPNIKNKTDWCYIAPVSDLETITEAQILASLNRVRTR